MFIKKIVLAFGLATAGLPMGGCSTLQQLAVPGAITKEIQPVIDAAQQIAATACGFLPTVESIVNVLALNNPLLSTPEQMANAFCAAVTPASIGRGQAAVSKAGASGSGMVGGVAVTGKFIK